MEKRETNPHDIPTNHICPRGSLPTEKGQASLACGQRFGSGKKTKPAPYKAGGQQKKTSSNPDARVYKKGIFREEVRSAEKSQTDSVETTYTSRELQGHPKVIPKQEEKTPGIVPARSVGGIGYPTLLPTRLQREAMAKKTKQPASRGHPSKRKRRPKKQPPEKAEELEFAAEKEEGSSADKPKSKGRGKRILQDVLYFGALLAVVVGVLFYKQQTTGSQGILGTYFFTVLSESMQSEIPKGSLVVVKNLPGAELQIGDDVTFMRDADTVVTHRIIQITENYDGSGLRGFTTKGIENYEPDPGVVHEANVIGKVVKVIPKAGFYTSLVGANLKWIGLGLGFLTVLILSLRVLFPKQEKTGRKQKNKQAPVPDR